MLGFRNVIIAAVLACFVGFCGGWSVKAKFYEAAEAKAAKAEVTQVKATIVENVAKTEVLESKIEKQKAKSDAVKVVVVKSIEKREIHNEDGSICSPNLSVGDVWLLNSTRMPNAESTSLNPDESAAASTIGAKELAADSVEVVKRYNDLAERHNLLVEEVLQFIKKQAE